jgi:nucleoside-diphosphate-sugar epimerase
LTMRVLVTGATGFVGRALCAALTGRGFRVRGATRAACPTSETMPEVAVVGQIGSHTDWAAALDGVRLVMHLAARAHLPRDAVDVDAYDEVNTQGTAQLAAAAARAGVARLVYLSSVKVNGEASGPRPFSATDEPHPADAYAVSKWRGELALGAATKGSSMEYATLRAPLVYGAGVRANFLRLMRWVDRGTPLPFARVRNLRSLINVWNLADALIRVAEHPAAAGQVWLVSDGTDLSTPDLIRALGGALGRRVRLLPVPVPVLRLMGALTGHQQELERLCNSLVIEISPMRSLIGWRPVVTLNEALARTVAWYRNQ